MRLPELRSCEWQKGNNELQPDGLVAITDAVSELDSLARIFAIFGNLAYVPQELLTIFIAFAGGILGCTMQIGRDVFFNPSGQTERSLLAPLFGGLVALVLFVVVKAGVLVAVEQRAAGPNSELNPFFVTFLGIVGGALSDQVVEKVRVAGQEWLKSSSTNRPRWYIGGPLPVDANRSEELLSRFLDIENETTRGILAGRVTADQRQQYTIAVFLGRPARELFTDIGPVV